MDSLLDRLVLPVSHGYKFVNVGDIIRLESSTNYSYIFLNDGQSVLISKSLKKIEELLPKPQFCRVHASHIVNLNEIDLFIREDGARITMNDQSIIPVSRRRQIEFKESLKKINLMF